MVLYRRNRIAGASYFFTVTLRDRRSDLLLRHIDLLRDAFSKTRASTPFSINAIVILPDHLHTIWTLPNGDSDYPTRWRSIKARFTRLLCKKTGTPIPSPWQPRYWEHTLRDEKDFQRHMDYIHYNPVKHGHVTHIIDWPHSSFHRLIKQEVYPADWGCSVDGADFGE